MRQQGLGGWALDVHHTYDPHSGTLYQGDGGRRSAQQFEAISTISGFCVSSLNNGVNYYGDGGPAIDASLKYPAALAFGPDGSLYIADRGNQRIRRIDMDGIITTVAGNGEVGFGDGGPATAAMLSDPSDIAVGLDGSLYIADTGNRRIRRVAPDGVISTFAGGNPVPTSGNDGPATSAWLLSLLGVAIGPDGSLYIADASAHLIRRVGPNGIITTVAGSGSVGSSGDGGSALRAGIGYPYDVVVGPDGSLYIADNSNNRIRRVAPNGIITTVAGASTPLLGDGGPATAAQLARPFQIAIGRDGSLYIADQFHNRVRLVQPNGIITTIAGNGIILPIGDNGPAAAASFYHPRGIALRQDGSLFIADTLHQCIRRVGAVTASSNLSGYIIPAQSGAELYEFDYAGRHLRTLNAFTGATIYTFTYDTSGRLTEITDRDSRVTTIQRDSGGVPIAIVGPDGQRTALAVDTASHLVGMTNPACETTSFEYTPEGLLTRLTDSRGGVHSFTYDDQGRLTRDTNPAGGFTALARSDDDSDGYTVTTTNALGDATTMRVEMLPGGEQRRVNIAPNGAATTTLIKPDGTRVITDTRGNVTTSVEAPDPRWGMQVPFVESLTIKTADGQVFYRLTASRTALLSVPADPLSLRSQTDTITINGRTTTTVFDVASRTRTTTDPAGKRSVVTLDAQGRLLREETTNLVPKQYAYDPLGQLVDVTEGAGADTRTTTLAYDAQGYPASTTDPLGGTTSYTYDLVGRMLSRTLPTGHTFTFTYDAAGNRTSSTDPQGLRASYEYDLQNQLAATTLDPDGRAIRSEYAYDPAGNLVARVDDAGSGRLNTTTRYEYTPIDGASAYAVSRMIDPLGHATRYTYTPSGEISSSTDPLSHTTVLTYTAQGWRGAITTPGGHTTLTTYNDNAQVVSVTDPRGSRTIFTYDAAGRLKTAIAGAQDVDGQTVFHQTLSYDYDANGRVVSLTDPRGMVTTRSYDSFGRLVEEHDPLGTTSTFGYDALDRLIQIAAGSSDPGELRRTAYDYDAVGRLLAERVDPDGLNLATRYHYTGAGGDTWSLQAVEDPQGNLTTYHYNSMGLRDAVTDALGQTWAFEYDNLGHLVDQADPLGHNSGTVYDPLGRRVSLTQDGRTEHWAYNADSTLAAFTDFMGRVTMFAYDADMRLAGIDYPDGTPDVSYAYDAVGNLVAMADGLRTTTYVYDMLNRLRQRSRDGRSVTYDYTADNQVAQIDYWGRGAAQYSYDDAGRLSSMAPWGAPATSYTYRGDGLLASQTRGNSATTTYGYDSAGRLTELLHQHSAAALDDIYYTLDANGNRTHMADADGATTYAYDVLDRLTQVSYPAIPGDLPAATVDYTLDGVGNRLSDGTVSLSYDTGDRIASPGYVYDGNGNLLSDGATSYAYDAANRLVQTNKGGVTTTYGYDGNGNLVCETVGGITTDFVLDERGPLPHILGEVRSDGTETLYAYGTDGFVAQQTIVGGAPQAIQYPLLDGLGSVRHLADASGALMLSRGYDAFGAIRHASGAGQSRMGFTGEPMGVLDGTIYLRARHYSPVLGRFLQRDTFGGFAARPQSLNRYAYGENNPARFTDPSGHCPFCIAVAAGAVIGAAIEYGTQVYGNYQNGQSGWDAWTNVQADKIGYAAVGGAIIGGVGFVAGPLVGALTKTGLLGAVTAGALEGMTASSLGQIAVNLLKGCVWDSNLMQALLSGGLSGGLGGGLGWAGRQIFRSPAHLPTQLGGGPQGTQPGRKCVDRKLYKAF